MESQGRGLGMHFWGARLALLWCRYFVHLVCCTCTRPIASYQLPCIKAVESSSFRIMFLELFVFAFLQRPWHAKLHVA
jgi:hypothetical protein